MPDRACWEGYARHSAVWLLIAPRLVAVLVSLHTLNVVPFERAGLLWPTFRSFETRLDNDPMVSSAADKLRVSCQHRPSADLKGENGPRRKQPASVSNRDEEPHRQCWSVASPFSFRTKLHTMIDRIRRSLIRQLTRVSPSDRLLPSDPAPEPWRLYRAALKATLVLFPLLGLTHLLFAINPHDSIAIPRLKEAYLVLSAAMQSSQVQGDRCD